MVMNKLAFFGVIILGLVLLITHLVVTFIMIFGPVYIDLKYDAHRFADGFKNKFEELGAEVGEELAGLIKESIQEVKSQNDTMPEPVESYDDSFTRRQEALDQNDVNELVKRLNKESKRVRVELGEFDKRVGELSIDIPKEQVTKIPMGTFTYKYEDYELPVWRILYGLIGSLLIICGTVFLAIASLKRIETTKQPDD